MRKFILTFRRFVKRVLGSFKSSLAPDKFYSSEFLSEKFAQKVGKFTNGDIRILNPDDRGELYVGNYCSIAAGVTVLLGGNHRLEWVSIYPFPASPRFKEVSADIKNYSISHGDVIVGNDVQLGHDALILSGVTIGDGAIIGAGAVVAKNVPPYAIVAGNRAEIVGFRFTQKQIDELLKIKWWNWDEEKVARNVHLISSRDIDGFIKKFKS